MCGEDGHKNCAGELEAPIGLLRSPGPLALKKRMREWKAKLKGARKTSATEMREPSSVRYERSASPGSVLIDPLEQRLLYSADHPLGLAVSAADLQDELTQFEDAQLVSALLDELRQQPLADADTQGLLDDGDFGSNIIVVTTEVDSLDAADMSSFADFASGAGGDDLVSLREAIEVANSDSSVGKIMLPNGNFTLTLDQSDPGDDNNLEGDLDLMGTYIIQGGSEDGTIISQSIEGRRVFEIRSGEISFADLKISGYVDEDGNATVGSAGAAAFVHSGTSAHFSDVTLNQNISNQQGGALYVAGDATLENVEISANSSRLAGGGVYVDELGQVVINSSLLGGNETTGNGTGGALHVIGRADLTDVTISGNEANGEGGGLYLAEDAIANLVVSPVRDNVSHDDGGGIYSEGELDIQGGQLSGNSVTNENDEIPTRGGGLFLSNTGEATIRETNIDNNTAKSGGAGIYNAGELTLSNLSVTNHSVSSANGGGIYITDTGMASLTAVGVHQNFALQGGGIYSEGILGIQNATVSENNAQEDGGGIYNKGFATLSPIQLNTNDAAQGQGGGIYNEGELEIRNSGLNNNSAQEDGGGIYNKNVATLSEVQLTINRAAQGGGIYNEGELEISNSGINDNRAQKGGGIYSEGTAELTDVFVQRNEAEQGGGIYSESDRLDITDIHVIGNQAQQGGGIYSAGDLYIDIAEFAGNSVSSEEPGSTLDGAGLYISDGNADIQNSVFRNNTAPFNGGGIYNEADLTLRDSSLIGNEAGISGGGLANFAGRADLERVTIWGNTANAIVGGGGAGIYNGTQATLDVNYSVVANNTSELNSAGIYSFGNAVIANSRVLSNTTISGSAAGGIGFSSTSEQKLILTNSTVANNTTNGISNDVSATGASVSSGGFNLIESATEEISGIVDLQGTDIINVDPGFGAIPTNEPPAGELDPDKIYLVDNQVQYLVDSESATLHTGSTDGIGDITIDGTVVGNAPNIGGVTTSEAGNVTNGLVFWIGNDNKIYRSDAQFRFAQLIVEDTSLPTDIEVDAEGRHIYWLDQVSHVIKRANLDGTDIQEIQLVDITTREFVLDIENARFFTLSNVDSPSINQYFFTREYATEADERKGEVVYSSDDSLGALELDHTDDVLYWAEAGGTDSANLVSLQTRPFGVDPQETIEQIVPADPASVNNPSSIAVIESADQIFWAEPDQEELARFDENAVPSTLSFSYSSSSTTPQEIEYDPLNDRILVAGQQSTIFWISTEFDESGEVGTVPQIISDMAYAVIESVTDAPTEQPPILVVNAGQSVEKGESVDLSEAELLVTDADTPANRIRYSLDSPVSDIAVYLNSDQVSVFTQEDISLGRITIEHSGVHIGNGTVWTIELPLTVTDDDTGQSLSVPFEVTVSGTNEPPTHEAIPSLTVFEGATLALDNSVLPVTDVDTRDADVLFVIRGQAGGVIRVDGSPLAVLDSFTLEQLKTPGIVEYRHLGDEPSLVQSYIELDIQDQESGRISIPRIEIEVTPVSDSAPQAEGEIVDQTAQENSQFSLTLQATLFSSPEGEEARPFSWVVGRADGSALPDWLSFNETTLTLSGTPRDADTGLLDLEVRVTDSNGLVSEPVSLRIDVQDINQAPEISGNSLLPVSENIAGAVIGQVQATDLDSADTLTYTANDTRFEFDGNTLKLKGNESLDHEAESSVSLEVQVSDGHGLSDSQSIAVEVRDENDVPQIDTPLGEQELDENSVVALDADTFTDQDNDSLRYSLARVDGQALPDWIVFDTDTAEMSLGVAPAEISTAQLSLTVDDGRGGTAQMLFVVRYFPEPEEPEEPEEPSR